MEAFSFVFYDGTVEIRDGGIDDFGIGELFDPLKEK